MSVLAVAEREARSAAEASPVLLDEALADLRVDFDELLFLVDGAHATLAAAAAELGVHRQALHAGTFGTLNAEIRAARSRWRAAQSRLLALRRRAGPDGEPTPWLLAELASEKAAIADLLRVEQALAAALASAADWQSPSFLHSTRPAAGTQCGRITPHWNDYKRDRHLDADAYERAYVAEMVNGPPDLRALLTACGMAAFTTVVAFLRDEGRLDRSIVIGRGLYHESRQLLERAFPGRVHVVDERRADLLERAMDELRPGAIFLDSLSNSKWMPVPDLAAVAERLRGRDAYLVVDNTGLSVSCQPFAPAENATWLIAFESLLKYAQLGLDRANAGLILARDDDAEALAAYREHLGTNIADVAVHALPRPDRRVLERRLARLQRNATLLAERLREEGGGLAEVVYPGLPGHPSHGVARALAFRGGCLSLVLRRSDGRLGRERALVEVAVAEAAHRGVPLLAGSSFGFDTTRVYLTAARAEHGEPFVRVAAGTEHRLQTEAVAEALAAAVRRAGR